MAARIEDIDRGNKVVAATTMAQRADRHELYEASVQDVETECDFITETFRELRGRNPVTFREDFCGTASACCEWVKRGTRQQAFGVDIDASVLQWGRQHRLNGLTEDQRHRVTLVEGNVMTAATPAVDVVGAFNFSYFIFKRREQLREYFTAVKRSLGPDGVFFLDAFGGYEAFEEMKEKTKHDGFTYVWDQARYYPVTGELLCHIHFRFPDGSKLKKAFTYDWRLWTLPEIREVLGEAGFGKSTVYWEGTDDDGDGNGEFAPEEHGEADAGWIAYIVAEQ